MGIAVSLLLIAVGAILVWAVEATIAGVDINAVGWILLIVGAIGAVVSLVRGFGRRREEDRVIVDR